MSSRFPAGTFKTPILDQTAAPDPEVYWDTRPGDHPFVSGIIVILFGLTVWIAPFENYLWFGANVAVSYICLILAWYPCCFIHELGHLSTALLLRRRLLSFSLGPLSVARDRERIKIRLNRKNWITGGVVQCVPTRSGVSRCGEAAIAVAGPAATVLLAIAVLGVCPLTKPHVPAWEVPLLCIAVLSTVTNLLPFKTDIHVSDGYQLAGLWGRAGTARCAFAAMLGAIHRGKRPSAAIIASATAYARNPTDYVQANFIAYQLDRRIRFERALLYLEAALGRCEGRRAYSALACIGKPPTFRLVALASKQPSNGSDALRRSTRKRRGIVQNIKHRSCRWTYGFHPSNG